MLTKKRQLNPPHLINPRLISWEEFRSYSFADVDRAIDEWENSLRAAKAARKAEKRKL